MRILVTGGAGLIGMAARRLLAQSGHVVNAIDITDFGRCDPELVTLPFSDMDGIERLVAERGIDAIVHGGGVSGPVMLRERPADIADINIMSTARLLDIARRRHLKRFVLLSSHVVYGDVGPRRIDEILPLLPGTTYAATKVAGEALVESFRREFGVSAASLRLTRVYGPYRRANCFLREAIRNASLGRTTVIPCDPAYPYHYVYVDDVVRAISAVLEADVLPHAAYNVTSGEVVTMPEVAGALSSLLSDARIELVPGKDDAPDMQVDFSLNRMLQDFGWSPAFTLSQGLAVYVEAVRQDPSVLD